MGVILCLSPSQYQLSCIILRDRGVYRRTFSDWTMETAKKCQKSHKNSRHGYIMAVIFIVTFGILGMVTHYQDKIVLTKHIVVVMPCLKQQNCYNELKTAQKQLAWVHYGCDFCCDLWLSTLTISISVYNT